MRRAILFDGDDTLWDTETLYDNARQRARRAVEGDGLDGDEWEQLERALDVRNVERLGHSVARFPRSCVEAYEVLCTKAHRDADPLVLKRVRTEAQGVFMEKAPLLLGARETLAALVARGFVLALLTKGDPSVQRRRIDQSGLASFFDRIEIVEQKTDESITSLLARLDVPSTAALSVGNSVRSDVLPSLSAGVQPVWIDAHVWEYEREHEDVPSDAIIEIVNLGALVGVVDKRFGARA